MRKIKQWAVRNKKQLWIGIGVFVFVYFVWPTPYIYTRSSGVVHRVNRFTGQSSYGTSSGWREGSSGSSYVNRDEDYWEREAKAEERKWAREDRRY